jgi:hypothetical protein
MPLIATIVLLRTNKPAGFAGRRRERRFDRTFSAVRHAARSWAASVVVVTMLASVGCWLSASTSAHAYGFTITHWDVLPYPGINNAPGSFYVDTANEWERRFKWTVDTAHSTRVSYNMCTDYGYFDSVDIAAHDFGTGRYFSTNYNTIWYAQQCAVIRGYTFGGSTLFNGDGEVLL